MSVALPLPIATIAPRVDRRLESFLAAEVERWRAVDDQAARPVETIRGILGGGKRLRPAFCFWAFVGAGGDPHHPVITDAGAALEMLHAAALVHDDVIDRSSLRRGRQTVHVAYAATHEAGAWRGDSDRFGEGVAVVLGDLALVYSGALMRDAPRDAWDVFDEMRLEVNIGQYLDILGAATGAGSVEYATLVCRYKTAKYSVERPLHLGAALAAPGRLAQLTPWLSEFGLALGEAFQLRDDVLGVFGDAAVTGKPVGDDLREGKATRLASLARSSATGPAARTFEDLFGDPGLSDADVAALQEVIEDTGARADVERRIEELLRSAHDALGRLPLTAESRAALGELAVLAIDRDR